MAALWWLSFSDPSAPKGSQFLGVCIIEAPGFIAAVDRAHQLGCNPGGEVLGEELEDGDPVPPSSYLHRLLGPQEMDDMKKNPVAPAYAYWRTHLT